MQVEAIELPELPRASEHQSDYPLSEGYLGLNAPKLWLLSELPEPETGFLM